ncbi:MAG TPA: pirin family protein [Steroidobacteraceae bacterium]|nr:pirin family protein [Steroidobacteraceae bacterium]
MTTRSVDSIIDSIETSDGAGVKLRRSLGGRQRARVDPFLLLDEFFSDDPRDYLAGFPSHPHRGFETVTYMLDGHMEHQDHLGNRGDLEAGSVQWMTAGRGIVHSEMPRQTAGRMRGFQLWINLPAKEKMKPASYRDIPAEEIPTVALGKGARVKIIAGRLEHEGGTTQGPIRGVTTDPSYFDVELPAGAELSLPLATDHNALVYPYEGTLIVGPTANEIALQARSAGVLSRGDTFTARAGKQGAKFLLLAAKPIGEPVVQHGPFVMNTQQEIEQAILDLHSGRFVA